MPVHINNKLPPTAAFRVLSAKNAKSKVKYAKSLTKSKERIQQHGEVFTPPEIVNDMLKMLPSKGKESVWRIENPAKFLEPACGEGAFLTEIYRRKLKQVDSNYNKEKKNNPSKKKEELQEWWEFNAALQTSSIYGIELLEDNAEQCTMNLIRIFLSFYMKNFPKTQNEKVIETIQFLISRNIIQGNALTYRRCSVSCGNVCDECEEMIFSEWIPKTENGAFLLIRKDYTYEGIVKAESIKKEIQNSLFAEVEKNVEHGLKKEYPPIFWKEIKYA